MSDPVDVSDELNPNDAPGLISLIKGRQKEAEDGREVHDERWLRAYKNFRGIYDSMYDSLDSKSVPQAILIIAGYQYKAAFVADHEINMVACLTEIMASCKFK